MNHLQRVRFSILFFILLRFVKSEGADCLANQTDQGATFIEQLQDAVNAAACQLVNDTSFQDFTPEEGEEFDFIVVGAGSAGSVVANRLSEKGSWRVLLLEAGGDPTIATEVPRLREEVLGNDLDWQYKTEPQTKCCLENPEGRCSWTSGKVLGGSSTINRMAYVRGHPEDFTNWENQGNPGWGFKSILPYFKKSEDMRSESVLNQTEAFQFHSVGGLLKVDSLENTQISNILSEGFKQLGIDTFSDSNVEFGDGLFHRQFTIQDSRRCSTAKAFLHSFQNRPNLKISKNSLVVKVLLDQNKTAYGVSFRKNGANLTVNALKEIILSAGAVKSPQLLMLSGIGPAEHLREFGINVIQNLSVGYNLQDHIHFEGFPVQLLYESPTEDPIDGMFKFLVNREGYFTETGVLNVVSFITTSSAYYRNIQIIFLPMTSVSSLNYTVLFRPTPVRPKSRGRLSLKSANPYEHPSIQPNYLSDETDIQEFLDAIEFINNLVKTTALRNLNAEVKRVDIPDCQGLEFQSESYWRCVLKYRVDSSHHYCGTCKMGPEGNDSVVDPLLRVVGVSNLRVVDASIMPTITSGNTNAPVIAIAEKASDLIKLAWN